LITRPLGLSNYEKKKKVPESLNSEMGGFEEKYYHFILSFLIFFALYVVFHFPSHTAPFALLLLLLLLLKYLNEK